MSFLACFAPSLAALRGALLSGMLLLAAASASAQEGPANSKGQTIYLPVYSHIYHGNLNRKGQPDKVLLSALVSIRNTDPRRPIRILSARYFNTDGRVLREFVPTPKTIGAFGTHELFVERHDESGGSGANFVIVWDAEVPVNPPIIEGLHANIEGARSLLFTTQGMPIRAE